MLPPLVGAPPILYKDAGMSWRVTRRLAFTTFSRGRDLA